MVHRRSVAVALSALLSVGAGVRLAIAWAPFDPWQLRIGPLVDDSFYLFTIARNIASGLGPTHDGFGLTTGFQPLLTILAVPFYAALPDDPVLPIHLILSVLALAGVASGWALFRLGRRLAGPGAGLLACGVWCLSPYALEHGMNGLETGLALWLQLELLDWYLSRVREVVSPRTGDLLVTGALMALAYLARVDSALLLAAVALDILWIRHRRGWSLPRGFLGTALMAAGLTLPWHVYCLVTSGTLLPESGGAVRFLASVYSPIWGGPERAAGTLWYHLDSFESIAEVLLFQPTLPPPGIPLGMVATVLGVPVRWTALAYVALGIAAWVFRGRLRSVLPSVRFPGFLWVWLGLLVAAYAFWIPGRWFYPRYLFPVVTVLMLLSCLVFAALLRRLRPLPLTLMALALVGPATAVQAQMLLFRTDGMNIIGYYETVRMLERLEPLPEPVGIFQAGVAGYFAPIRIVALDGKVNGTVLEGLQSGRIFETLSALGVHLVTDNYSWLVELMFRACSSDEATPRIAVLTVPHPEVDYTWQVFLILDGFEGTLPKVLPE